MSKADCPSSPFVGLVPFREADAPFFRGRDTERDLIIENLRASRLTLLYGTSGVGKSSVLYAGAAHRLRELARQDLQEYGKPEFAVVTFGAWRDDPIQGLRKSINEAVRDALQVKSLSAVPETSDLAETISAWTERYGIELLFILDQFEEYFQYRPSEKGRGTFAEEFPLALNDPDVRAKFLLSLRDDALSRLDRFKSQIPNLFGNLLRIQHMTVEAAREAIVKPIEKYNTLCGFKRAKDQYSIEPALVDEVIKQVPRATMDGLGSRAGIAAPYLQLVLTRLWEKEGEKKPPSRKLRKRTLEDLKGIRNIVQVHLNDALKKLTSEQVEVAFHIFKYLVTPSGTKIAYYKSDLISQTRFTEAPINSVVEALDQGRILRTVPSPDRPDDQRYEIFHDLLAQAILNWRTEYEATSKAAAEQAAAIAALAEKERKRREAAAAEHTKATEKALKKALAAEKKAVAAEKKAKEQTRIVSEQLKQIRALQADLDALEEKRARELETIENTTTDSNTKAQIASYRQKYRFDKTRSLTSKQEKAVAGRQRKESKSGRPVKAGDQIRRKLWQNGKTLHIRFMTGTPELHQKIEQWAQEWTRSGANIKLLFDNSPDAEIRVGFNDKLGSWSYIGTDALAVSKDQPTINLGFFRQSEEVFRRSVLHEFGHVFGLIHEHQNPKAKIPWNKEVLYKTFSIPPNHWSRAQVDANFFNQYKGEYREFDPRSIMMISTIPKEWLRGDSFQPILELATALSESDKELIRNLYPP